MGFKISLYLFILSVTLPISVLGIKTSQFSQSYTIVEFNPILFLNSKQFAYQSESDYFPMIETISRKFSKVITTPLAINDSIAIARAIASYNNITNSGIEVLLCLDWKKLLLAVNRPIYYEADAIASSVIEVNYIYPNTINHVVINNFKFKSFFTVGYLEVRLLLKKLASSSIANFVKFGISVPLLECLDTYVNAFIGDQLISFVIFQNFTNDKSTLLRFITCTNEIRSEHNRKVNFFFATAWEPTENQVNSVGMTLSSYWENMNDWGEWLNTTVIISQAFDDIINPRPGWWNLVNKTYNNPSEFEFQERKTIQLRKFRNESAFATKSMIVGLIVPESTEPFTEHEIMQMIEVVATRFIKVYTLHVTLIPVTEQIILGIAKWNCANEKDLWLEVDVHAEFEDSDENFTATFELADSANAIHSETVKYIIFIFSVSDNELNSCSDQVEKARLESNTFQVKLGCLMSIKECNQPLHNISKFVNKLEFLLYNTSVITVGLRQEILNCKENLYRLNPEIEVGFIPTLTFNAERMYGEKYEETSALISYWKDWSEFAKGNNITIKMPSTFDLVVHWQTSILLPGWWNIVLRKRTLYDRLGLTFEEKTEAAERQAREKAENNSAPNNSNIISTNYPWVIIYILISIAIVIIVLGLLALLAWYIKFKNQTRHLSRDEIKEFFQGSEDNKIVDILAIEDQDRFVLALSSTAYSENYEVSKNHFCIFKEQTLGSGEFGQVCRGEITKDCEIYKVAVKMLKKYNVSALRGLLSEIKIMCYLGQHENIINLIGTYTEELKKGSVLLFTELCENGSLEGYLRRCKNADIFGMEDKLLGGTFNDVRLSLNNNDLYKWSCEIANGMEYLASKNVVHADLATRNVLLTIEMKAKISDFGLSRRLYNYTEYVKEQQEPLPWRWMAPESLCHRVFNEKTDVWAFGVTLWEIYSLGNLPFGDFSWDVNFVSYLEQGLRLGTPTYNINNVYSIMSRCWAGNSESRPKFSELKRILESVNKTISEAKEEKINQEETEYDILE